MQNPMLLAALSILLGASNACVSSSGDAGPDDTAALEAAQQATMAGCPLTPGQRGFVKWNPGHYIMGTGQDEAGQADRFLAAYGNIAAIKGLQKEYFWSAVEPTWNHYVWDQIDADIKKLSAAHKKLAIVIMYKYQVSDTESSLPRYILNLPDATVGSLTVPSYFEQGKTGDGAFNQGQHANFGHPRTRARFKALIKAFSDRYDSNPNVVSLSFIETSIGADVADAQQQLFLDGVLDMERYAACVLQHTPVFQNLNYPRNRLADFANNMTTNGIGLGGPDVFFDAMMHPDVGLGFNQPNQPQGVYLYYPKLAPIVPIGQQVHHENLLYPTRESMLPPPGTPHNLAPSVSLGKVYDFAVQQLEPNYMFWQVFAGDAYAAALNARFAADGLPLRTGCPSIYGGKCTP